MASKNDKESRRGCRSNVKAAGKKTGFNSPLARDITDYAWGARGEVVVVLPNNVVHTAEETSFAFGILDSIANSHRFSLQVTLLTTRFDHSS